MKYGIYRTELHDAIGKLICENAEEIKKDPRLRVSLKVRNNSDQDVAESIIFIDFATHRERDEYYWIEQHFQEPIWQLMMYAFQPGSEGSLVISFTRSMLHGTLGYFAQKTVKVGLPKDSLL